MQVKFNGKMTINIQGKGTIDAADLEQILIDSMTGVTYRDPKCFRLMDNNRVLTQSGNLELFTKNLNYFMNNSVYCKPDTVFKIMAQCGYLILFTK